MGLDSRGFELREGHDFVVGMFKTQGVSASPTEEAHSSPFRLDLNKFDCFFWFWFYWFNNLILRCKECDQLLLSFPTVALDLPLLTETNKLGEGLL